MRSMVFASGFPIESSKIAGESCHYHVLNTYLRMSQNSVEEKQKQKIQLEFGTELKKTTTTTRQVMTRKLMLVFLLYAETLK